MKRCSLTLSVCFASAVVAHATEYFASPDAVDGEMTTCLSEATAGTITNAFARATEDNDIVTLLPGSGGVYDMTRFVPRPANKKIVNANNASYFLSNKRIVVRSKAENPVTVALLGGGSAVDGRCFCFGAAAEIRGLTITNFYTGGQAAAIYSTDRSLVVSNCALNCNSCAAGYGALYNVKAVDCSMTGNHSAQSASVGENIDLVRCHIASNGCSRNFTGGVIGNSTFTDCTIGSDFCGYYQNNLTSDGFISNSTLTNCVVQGVLALRSPLLYKCTVYDTAFVDNNAVVSGCMANGSTLYDSGFTNNVTTGSTGACVRNSTCYDCSFVGNILTNNAHHCGGGAGSGGQYFNCKFLSNSALTTNSKGGALTNPELVSNCVFVANYAQTGGAIAKSGAGSAAFLAGASKYVILDSYFTNNWVLGSASGCLEGVTVSNCVIYGSCVKASGTYGGAGQWVVAYDSLFEDNVLTNLNYVVAGGGALANGVAVNCVFCGNRDVGTSAAAACFNVAMTNCFVYGNETIEGKFGAYGGCVVYASTPCVNCTIVSNKTAASYGACAGKFVNCIIADNGPCDVWSRKTYSADKLATSLSNCLYLTARATEPPDETAGCRQFGSTARLRFLSQAINDPKAYRLKPNSPAMDFGLDVGMTSANFDLDGCPRVHGKAIDAGCFECQDFPPGLSVIIR